MPAQHWITHRPRSLRYCSTNGIFLSCVYFWFMMASKLQPSLVIIVIPGFWGRQNKYPVFYLSFYLASSLPSQYIFRHFFFCFFGSFIFISNKNVRIRVEFFEKPAELDKMLQLISIENDSNEQGATNDVSNAAECRCRCSMHPSNCHK